MHTYNTHPWWKKKTLFSFTMGGVCDTPRHSLPMQAVTSQPEIKSDAPIAPKPEVNRRQELEVLLGSIRQVTAPLEAELAEIVRREDEVRNKKRAEDVEALRATIVKALHGLNALDEPFHVWVNSEMAPGDKYVWISAYAATTSRLSYANARLRGWRGILTTSEEDTPTEEKKA